MGLLTFSFSFAIKLKAKVQKKITLKYVDSWIDIFLLLLKYTWNLNSEINKHELIKAN